MSYKQGVKSVHNFQMPYKQGVKNKVTREGVLSIIFNFSDLIFNRLTTKVKVNTKLGQQAYRGYHLYVVCTIELVLWLSLTITHIP